MAQWPLICSFTPFLLFLSPVLGGTWEEDPLSLSRIVCGWGGSLSPSIIFLRWIGPSCLSFTAFMWARSFQTLSRRVASRRGWPLSHLAHQLLIPLDAVFSESGGLIYSLCRFSSTSRLCQGTSIIAPAGAWYPVRTMPRVHVGSLTLESSSVHSDIVPFCQGRMTFYMLYGHG